MAALIEMAKQAIADRKGVTAVEYGVIAAALVLAVSAAFSAFGTTLKTFFTNFTFTP